MNAAAHRHPHLRTDSTVTISSVSALVLARSRPLLLSAALALANATFAFAGTTVEIGTGDDLQASVDALGPGDVLVLEGGTYLLSSRFSIQAVGTAEQPITIRAKQGEVPIIEYPNANQNTINVEFAHHLELIGLEVTGGSHGIRLRESSFITIEDCHIHDVDDVALSANYKGSSYEGLRIVHNHIHDTNNSGEGMYLGCNYNGCQMFDSLIANNYVHNTDGPGVDQGDGIEIKEGSYNNVVRDNVIHDTNYPCIITYSTVGNGAPNLIEGNVLWGCGDQGIQSAADAVIRNNLILGGNADGIHSQPHQDGVPGNLVIVHNTVLATQGAAVRINSTAGPITIANNALYTNGGVAIRASGDLGQITSAGNVGDGSLIGVSTGFDGSGSLVADFVAASYSGALPQNVYPKAGSHLIQSGTPAFVAARDFDHQQRLGTADSGAYLWRPDGAPLWAIAEDFKQLVLFADGFESGDKAAWH